MINQSLHKTITTTEYRGNVLSQFTHFYNLKHVHSNTLIEELDTPLPRMTYQWNGLTLLNTGDPIEVQIAINIIQITDLFYCILLPSTLCVARSDFSEIARILTYSLNLVRIRSDFTFLSKKNAKIYFPFAGLFKKWSQLIWVFPLNFYLF